MVKLGDHIGRLGRPDEVWAFLETEATRGDPASVLATMDHYARNHAFLMNVGPEKGRLLHTLTNWGSGERLGNGQYAPSGVDFPIWSGGQHYPAAANCSLPPRQWCAAMQHGTHEYDGVVYKNWPNGLELLYSPS